MAVLSQSCFLIVAGMGVVALVLVLVVWAMKPSSAIARRFNLQLPTDGFTKKPNLAHPFAENDDGEIAAAIAAIFAHAGHDDDAAVAAAIAAVFAHSRNDDDTEVAVAIAAVASRAA